MNSLFENIFGTLAMIGIIGISLFFTAFPGMRFIRVNFYLRKLKKELEPVARAVGALTSTEWVTDKGQVMYFFEFPNEIWEFDIHLGKKHSVKAWLTLEVSEDGFNIYIPSFTPPMKLSEDYQALIRAVQRITERERELKS